jgi:diphthamide synthase (EF-2-diphthine--ammonia ligase)
MISEVIDEGLAPELAARCNPCGKNGEFHTLVLEAPIMGRDSVTIEDYDVLIANGHHLMAVKDYSVRRG